MPDGQGNVFLTYENLAFSLPLILTIAIYVSLLVDLQGCVTESGERLMLTLFDTSPFVARGGRPSLGRAGFYDLPRYCPGSEPDSSHLSFLSLRSQRCTLRSFL